MCLILSPTRSPVKWCMRVSSPEGFGTVQTQALPGVHNGGLLRGRLGGEIQTEIGQEGSTLRGMMSAFATSGSCPLCCGSESCRFAPRESAPGGHRVPQTPRPLASRRDSDGERDAALMSDTPFAIAVRLRVGASMSRGEAGRRPKGANRGEPTISFNVRCAPYPMRSTRH